MGVSLFHRHGPHIFLTTEGQKLFEYALPLVNSIENLKGLFGAHIEEETRTDLNVVVNSTTLNFIMPAMARDYIEQNADHYIHLHYAEHEEAIQKVLSEEVDFALLPKRYHLAFPGEISYKPLFYYKPCLITRPDHPLAGRTHLSVQEICQYELTLPDPDLRVIPNLYDIFPEHSINKKLRINFINWETTRKYIEEGLVISISSDVIINANDQLVATPLLHLFAPVDYGMVTKTGKALPEKVRKFLSLARRKAKTINSWYFDAI